MIPGTLYIIIAPGEGLIFCFCFWCCNEYIYLFIYIKEVSIKEVLKLNIEEYHLTVSNLLSFSLISVNCFLFVYAYFESDKPYSSGIFMMNSFSWTDKRRKILRTSFKKIVLKNSAMPTEKQLWWSLFLTKLQDL